MQTGRSAGPARCGLTRSGHRIEVSGEIDEANAAALGARFESALDDGVTVVDLTEVTFFSAAGLRALLTLAPVAAARGVALRVSCSPQVWRVFELCGIPGVSGLAVEPPPSRQPLEGAAS